MRMKLPVTGNEYQFSAVPALLPTTDLKVRTLDSNPFFIVLSSFTKKGLLEWHTK